MLYQPVRRFVVGPWVYAWQRPLVTGREHIPRTGPVILASNHVGFSEALTIPVVCPRRLTFPVKREWFEGSGPHGKALGWFLNSIGQIPVDRSGGAAGAPAMSASEEVLTEGGALAIFPEGTRSPDGRLYRGHTGIARLIMATGAPVIPVGVKGIGSEKSPRPEVHFGEPISFPQGMKNGKVAREMTDQIMAAIRALTGQEYVDMYAADFRRQQAETAAEDAPQGGPQLPAGQDSSAPAQDA